MKPAPFTYERAESVRHALGRLNVTDEEDAPKILAGGQSLIPMMNLRLARPEHLVDIGGLAELERIFDDDQDVVIGALTTHHRLHTDPTITRRLPLVAAAAGHIGHPAIRHRGTLGGSLAHADPAAELPLTMVVHDARIRLESAARGPRTIHADEFFSSTFTTTMAHDELLTWVTVPALAGSQGWGFAETATRPGDFALAGAAALITCDAAGLISSVRAGLMSIADRPLLVDVSAHVTGAAPTRRLWEQAVEHATTDLQIVGDDAEYRRRIARYVLEEALADAGHRAQHEQEAG